MVKNPPVNAGDTDSIPDWEDALEKGMATHSTPLQYSCLENLMDRGAWRAIVHGVAKSRTRLSTPAGLYISPVFFLSVQLSVDI